MNVSLTQFETLRHGLLALRRRTAAVAEHARSTDWPYAGQTCQVRRLALELVDEANTLVDSAAAHLGLADRASPLTEESTGFQTHFEAYSRRLGLDIESAQAIALALACRLVRAAEVLVSSSEDCLEGDEGLDGQHIVHGSLWYK